MPTPVVARRWNEVQQQAAVVAVHEVDRAVPPPVVDEPAHLLRRAGPCRRFRSSRQALHPHATAPTTPRHLSA